MVRTRNQNDIMRLMIINPTGKTTSWEISMVNMFSEEHFC